MPFTFSHPAIILPLTFLPKRFYSFTGLVVGSLVPDFEYFFRLRLQSHISHDIAGLFLFNLPLGMLLAYVYHAYVRDAFIDNLPGFFRKHLLHFKGQHWSAYFRNNWLVVALSVLVGAASHIFWDSFTHADKLSVQLLPFLQADVTLLGIEFPRYRVVQHVSTLVGGAFILYAIKMQPVHGLYVSRKVSTRYWVTVVVIMLLFLALRLLGDLYYKSYAHIIATLIGGGLWGILIASIYEKKVAAKALEA